MTSDAVAPLARAQRLARAASTIAVIGAVMLALTAALDVAAPGVRALTTLASGWDGVKELARIVAEQWLLALPSFILAGVCVDLGRVLGEYAKGRFFTRVASANVRKAGEGVLTAMAFQCVLSPTLHSFVAEAGAGRAFTVRFETFDAGLIAIGAFIMVIGRVLEAAAAIKDENDEIV